jgi:hypothetical protein
MEEHTMATEHHFFDVVQFLGFWGSCCQLFSAEISQLVRHCAGVKDLVGAVQTALLTRELLIGTTA